MDELIVLDEDIFTEDIDILDMIMDNHIMVMIESSKINLPLKDGRLYIDDRKKNWLYVYVFGSEGPYPHFHIYDKDTKGYKDLEHEGTCVSLIENRYFDHGYHYDKLSKAEFDTLTSYIMNEKVQSLHPKKNGTYRMIPVWRYLVAAWNELNPNFQIKPGTKCPRYSFEKVKEWKDK